MRINNRPVHRAKTHEGGRADAHQKPVQELERAVATCMLFENTFYESGSDISERIAELCKKVPVENVAALAVKARNDYKLRHVPLFLCLQLLTLASGREDGLASKTIAQVVQRPDEMGELLSLYWKGRRKPLSAQLKKGLRGVFGKFSAYQLQKWDRDATVKIRDVAFLVHPVAANAERGTIYAKLLNKSFYPEKTKSGAAVKYAYGLGEFEKLETADTWEVGLSKGSDKKETWERLLSEKKLGYMALLMNLRNMTKVNVSPDLIEKALLEGALKSKALPFRFVSAAKYAPEFAQTLSDAMVSALGDAKKLPGSTIVLVDVSGSMEDALSAKSELTRMDAAGALAVLLREVCESCRVYTFSEDVVAVGNYRGLPLHHGIRESQRHASTRLAEALVTLKSKAFKADRLIVVTDEQSHDGTDRNWTKNGYICNVAPYKPGLETSGGWTRINGWSERVIDWMHFEEEKSESAPAQ